MYGLYIETRHQQDSVSAPKEFFFLSSFTDNQILQIFQMNNRHFCVSPVALKESVSSIRDLCARGGEMYVYAE